MKNSHCRDPKMEAYCDEVRRLEDKFCGLELNHIARRYNETANELAKIASGRTTVPPDVLSRDLHQPSVKADDTPEPEKASAQPEAPSARSEAPSARSEAPSARPEAPSAQPEEPSAQPEVPSAPEGEALDVEEEQSGAKGENRMKNIFKIFISDVKRIFQNVVAVVVIISAHGIARSPSPISGTS